MHPSARTRRRRSDLQPRPQDTLNTDDNHNAQSAVNTQGVRLLRIRRHRIAALHTRARHLVGQVAPRSSARVPATGRRDYTRKAVRRRLQLLLRGCEYGGFGHCHCPVTMLRHGDRPMTKEPHASDMPPQHHTASASCLRGTSIFRKSPSFGQACACQLSKFHCANLSAAFRLRHGAVATRGPERSMRTDSMPARR